MKTDVSFERFRSSKGLPKVCPQFYSGECRLHTRQCGQACGAHMGSCKSFGGNSSRWANGPEIVDPHKNHVNGSHVNNISSKFSEI